MSGEKSGQSDKPVGQLKRTSIAIVFCSCPRNKEARTYMVSEKRTCVSVQRRKSPSVASSSGSDGGSWVAFRFPAFSSPVPLLFLALAFCFCAVAPFFAIWSSVTRWSNSSGGTTWQNRTSPNSNFRTLNKVPFTTPYRSRSPRTSIPLPQHLPLTRSHQPEAIDQLSSPGVLFFIGK